MLDRESYRRQVVALRFIATAQHGLWCRIKMCC